MSSGSSAPGQASGDIYRRTYTWTADQINRIDTCALNETVAHTETFQYDRALRLTSATRPSGTLTVDAGAYASRTYGYDRRGNRTSMEEDGITSTLLYATGSNYGPTRDQLWKKTSSADAAFEDAYLYDASGRIYKKEWGNRGAQMGYAHTLELSYLDSDNRGAGWPFPPTAADSVFKYLMIDGSSYNYFYDAFGRRRLKQYPLGAKDEFFYSLGGVLMSDRGNNRVAEPVDYHVEDDYVWLGGRPVVLIRGKLTPSWARLSDATPDCARNGEASACGVYFPITDHVGKPVLMLDSSRRITNVADYDPFGHVNRVTQHVRAPPYSLMPSDTSVALLHQEVTSSLMSLRMRALFAMTDTVKNSPACTSVPFDAYVVLRNPSTGADVSEFIGGRAQQSSWVPAPSGSLNVSFVTTGVSSTMQAYEEETGYYVCEPLPLGAGVALKGYEYQRYQIGAQPFWTPLRFPGHYYDAETDLHENWNRYYDPSMGRYLQPEPMLAMGPAALPAYAYALNNPLGFVDSTGLEPDAYLATHEAVTYGGSQPWDPGFQTEIAGYQKQAALMGLASVGTVAALASAEIAIPAACVAARKTWKNLSFDGPSKGVWHAQGRIFGVRWKGGQAGIRLDLHPRTPGGNPILHINYGAPMRENNHLDLWDPIEWWNRP